MRCIGGNVGKKWFLLLYTLPNEFMPEFKKHIGAKSFSLNNFSIMKIASVKISVVPDIRSLPHPAASVSVYLSKPPVLWPVGIVVSEVPFPKHSRLVSIFLKELTERPFLGPQHRAAHNGVPYSCPVGPVTGHQSRPGGGTSGSHMVVRQPNRFIGKLVGMGRLNHRISGAS